MKQPSVSSNGRGSWQMEKRGETPSKLTDFIRSLRVSSPNEFKLTVTNPSIVTDRDEASYN